MVILRLMTKYKRIVVKFYSNKLFASKYLNHVEKSKSKILFQIAFLFYGINGFKYNRVNE